MLKNILRVFMDLYTQHIPSGRSRPAGVAFLMHLRQVDDTYRKFPFFRYLPERVTLFFLRLLWPITVSKITGLRSVHGGHEIPGWVICVPLTAKQMMENRDLARRKILQGVQLARHKGVTMVALGALTASFTHGGSYITERTTTGITTGHAYTVYNVTQTLLSIIRVLHDAPERAVLAIVGANGSIGSNCARILVDQPFKKILLIDVTDRHEGLDELITELLAINPSAVLEVSHQVQAVIDADYIITATNAPEALIKADDLKSGAVVVDDAQPTDVDVSVFERDDVLVLEAGAVHTPGISPNFDLDLNDKYENFSCLTEAFILTATDRKDLAVIGRATLSQVREIGELGKQLGFTVAQFQNQTGRITPVHLNYIEKIKGYN